MSKSPVTTEENIPTKFEDLNLIPPLLQAVKRVGYKVASPIQAQLIPVAATGADVIGQAQTGTGKTAAYLIPFMNAWRGGDLKKPQAIVLAPTRELAIQVGEEAVKLSPSKHFRSAVIYGGAGFGLQNQQLAEGRTLIVGTPGRVLDHIGRGTLQLDKVKYLVLDEADRMLDIGFRPQIERILKTITRDRQTLLMSATLPADVLKLTERYMRNPVHVNVSPEVVTVDRIDQSYITVDEDRKTELLLKLLATDNPRQCIIFVERKRGCDNLARQLKRHKIRCAAIHGDLQQNMRERIMAAFRDGRISVLIATDVMSRGIDVSGISHIVNYDLPNDNENYVHRIGRTGRMGADGKAITFVMPDEGEVLTEIEMTINKIIPARIVEGFEAFRPKAPPKSDEPPKQSLPVYGRAGRKYSNRL